MKQITICSILMLLALLAIPLVSGAGEDGPRCGAEPFMGPGLSGGGPGCHGGMMGRHLGRMAEELDLTDEQKAEIRAIMAEELPAAHEQVRGKVLETLTPEQQEKFEALKEEFPGAGRRGPRGMGMKGQDRPMGGLIMRMADELELTDEQREQIRGVIAEASPETRGELREQIHGVLTPEQQEKLAALRERNPRGKGRGGQGRGMAGPGHGSGGHGMGMGGHGRFMMGRLGRMAEELDLTDEQIDTIHEIMMDEIPEIHKQVKSKISTVLTPEQQEEMERMIEEHRERMKSWIEKF